jgi:predicted transcriptional regulator of viral defense system
MSFGVDCLSLKETVLTLLDECNGYLTTKVAKEKGVDNKSLQRMAGHGLIEHAAHGLYIGADIIPDPFVVTQYRCPKGIFSHETALFLHDLSDRVPLRLTMTIPSGWNSQLLTDENLLFFYCKPSLIGLGVTETETPSGLKVNTYDSERTICDCLRSREKMDMDLVLSALKQYMKSSVKDNIKLLEYAAMFKIREMVRRYIEVLS